MLTIFCFVKLSKTRISFLELKKAVYHQCDQRDRTVQDVPLGSSGTERPGAIDAELVPVSRLMSGKR